MILGNYGILWRLQEAILQNRKNIQVHNITVQHCLKEGNDVMDLLSKHAITVTDKVFFFLRECDIPRAVISDLIECKFQDLG